MGNFIENFKCNSPLGLCEKKKFYVKITGPANSGKTSIVRYLKNKKFLKSPNTSLDVEKIIFNDYTLIILDQSKRNSNIGSINSQTLHIVGVIFVIDGSDPGRIRIANKMLTNLLDEPNDVSVLLVFATKQDKPEALSVEDVREMLMLNNIYDKECGVFSCSAKTGEGINEGMRWFCNELDMINYKKTVCNCGLMNPFDEVIRNH